MKVSGMTDQEQTTKRVIETQLWPEQDDPTYGRGISVGLASEPLLAGVREGEQVILREPPDVEVDAVMHLVELNGREVWFGALSGAYRDLAPAQ
jgi:hypothetical protein